MTNLTFDLAQQTINATTTTQVPILATGSKVFIIIVILSLWYVLFFKRNDPNFTHYKLNNGKEVNLVKYARTALFLVVGGLLISVGLTYIING